MKKVNSKNYDLFLETKETAYESWIRLNVLGEQYLEYKKNHNKPLKILDIGCGKDVYLYKFKKAEDKYYGCDYYEKPKIKLSGYAQIDLNTESLSKKFRQKQFDVIYCGEVIEHLFSPDDLLEEIKKVMHKDSILILSTPNLAYYINRILLIVGISPLFLENSAQYKLGRKYAALGQKNTTEGHIRVFTYGALKDLIQLKKYKIIKIIPVSVWGFWPDKIMHFFSKGFASDNIFILKK